MASENTLAIGLKSYEDTLSAQALFLEPLSGTITDRWAELYLDTFGRSAFFPSARVRKIFQELTDIFIGCLKEKCLDIYFENLKEKGRMFSRLGVPFEEILISLHLFEEICIEKFLDLYPHRSRLTSVIFAMEELHGLGLTTMATSYFEMTKKEMQKATDSLREDNELLRAELFQAKDSLFSLTKKEMQSMQLAISSINHKLKSRLSQLGRIQKAHDALDHEWNLTKLLKIASGQFISLCPVNTAVFFGLFDPGRKKINLYGQEARDSQAYELFKSFFFSELGRAFQDLLADNASKCLHLKGCQEMPAPMLEFTKVKNHREFLVLPVKRYDGAIGFTMVSTDVEGFFSKTNYRFFQRIGQVAAKAIVTSLLFAQNKKEEEFGLLLDEIGRRKADQKNLEALDFCMGSLISLLGVERSSVMRYDETKKELKVYAAKGHRVYPLSGLAIKWGEGIAGLALKESRIISIPRFNTKKTRPGWLAPFFKRKGKNDDKIKSLLCLPIFQTEKPLGVVNLSTINFYKNFEAPDIDMANQIVNRISDILRNLPSEIR